MSNIVPFPTPAPKPGLDLTELSFVHDYLIGDPGRKRRRRFRVFWAVSGSRSDYQRGHAMALEWLRLVGGLNIGTAILGWIVADMPRKLTGLELGFLSAIALMAGTNPYAEQVVQLRDEEDRRIKASMEVTDAG